MIDHQTSDASSGRTGTVTARSSEAGADGGVLDSYRVEYGNGETEEFDPVRCISHSCFHCLSLPFPDGSPPVSRTLPRSRHPAHRPFPRSASRSPWSTASRRPARSSGCTRRAGSACAPAGCRTCMLWLRRTCIAPRAAPTGRRGCGFRSRWPRCSSASCSPRQGAGLSAAWAPACVEEYAYAWGSKGFSGCTGVSLTGA